LYVTEKKIQITKHFDEYFTQGGFPEYLTTKNTDYLKLLYDNILYRDIMARYNLSSEKALKELMYLLANSLAKKISFNSLKKSLQLGSSTTVKEYCTYLENSFLIYLVNTFSYSLKTQLYLDKKTYLVDTRLAVNLGFRMSQDVGRLLENLVFIELKRKKKEVYYYSEKKECDFIIKDGAKITEALQVCYELHADNRERELEGLMEALHTFKLKQGIILTHDQTEEITKNGKKILVMPVFKWLLQL
jgi:predicted AAA+ superfamily ATPase